MGRRTDMNRRARKLIAKYCEAINLNSCEICGGTFGLAPAHRKNRRHYQTAEELADPKEWIALCIKHHMEIESNKDKTEALFRRLRK